MSVRAERLSGLLPGAGVEVLLVTGLVNVRYLTGYTGSNGVALIGRDTRIFITDFRYLVQAAKEVDDTFERLTVTAPRDLLDSVQDGLPAGPLRLGFEADHVSVRQHEHLRELLADRIELVGTSGLVEGLRAVKEPEELERIRAAAALADASFQRLLRQGLRGRTEREVALALETDMRARGAERLSFETIVAAGAQAAVVHAQPRDVEIKRGDLVVIDWGAELDQYCSDCTRTVAAGDPGGDATEIYELVLEAQETGVQAIAAGRGAKEVDLLAREVIEAAGQGENFGHGLGHGVGLEVHEGPRLSQLSENVTLEAGNVVTVEPGVYVPGRLGVRIEDLVVVTDDGHDILTSVPKRLMIVD
jgi:Xaa-Pro aminopeptidase